MSSSQDMRGMTVRTDRGTAERFERLCDDLGITVPECLTAMMHAAVRTGGAGITGENGFTLREVKEIRRMIEDVKNGHAETSSLA